jgi:hypothetical protein
MLVNRDGRDVNIAAEFEVAQRIGLPTTTDLDKFLVFLKIAGEQRALYGSIVNPIRFTGGRMLSELRLADSGPNYEAIDAWCQRMKSTTIRSEMAVYLSQSQKYANRSISVFRGYQRIGEKSRTSRTDKFEVIIEDWLIENLNNNFAVIEDLSTYILLTRPIAKGIFGHLLVWFRASNGRKVEKDYTRLCALLNIKAFTQLSRIRDNLGKSLDELKSIKYLSHWEIARMTSKDGYKINMWPGDNLLYFLRNHTPALGRKSQLLIDTVSDSSTSSVKTFTEEQKRGMDALLAYGVARGRAEQLASRFTVEEIADHIEYVDSISHPANKRKIGNPPGLLIHFLEEDLPVPADFITSRKRKPDSRPLAGTALSGGLQMLAPEADDAAYQAWVNKQVDGSIAKNFPGSSLAERLKKEAQKQSATNALFAKIPEQHQEEVALLVLRKEIQEDLALPAREDWCKMHTQYDLFS